MGGRQLHTMFFGQPWRRCTIRLSSGRTIGVERVDSILMPPHKLWFIYVPPEGPFQFVDAHHVEGVELEPLKAAGPARKGAR